MVGYLVTKNGKSRAIPALERAGYLVEPDTTMPIILPEVLHSHPARARLEPLIAEARPAAHAIGMLVEQLRADDREARRIEEGMAPEVGASLRKKRRSAYKKQMWDVRRQSTAEFPNGARMPIHMLWNDDAIPHIALKAPKPALLVDKIAEGDFNFTPAEVTALLKAPGGVSVVNATGGQSTAYALLEADRAGDHIKSDGNSPFVRRFMEILNSGDKDAARAYLRSDCTPRASHMLGYDNFYPIRTLLEHDYAFGTELLHMVDKGQQEKILRLVGDKPIIHMAKLGNVEAARSFLSTLTKNNKSRIEKIFIPACEYGHEEIVKLCLQVMYRMENKTYPKKASKPEDAWMPAQLIFDRNNAKAIVKRGYIAAAKAGQKEIKNLLKERVPGKLLQQHFSSTAENPPVAESVHQSMHLDIPPLKLPMADLVPKDPATCLPKPPHPEFKREVYDALIPWIMLISGLYGLKGLAGHTEPEKIAYAFATLFDSAEQAKSYIRKISGCHDIAKQAEGFMKALNVRLPYAEHYDIAAWRRFIQIHGPEASALLPEAAAIEHAFAEEQDKLKDQGGNPWVFSKCTITKLKELHALVMKKRDPHWEQLLDIPEILAFCAKWDIPAVTGNGCKSTWLEYQRKMALGEMQDHIPDIGIIDGTDVGKPDYYMMKLPKGDLRCLVIPNFIPKTCTGPHSNLAKAHMLNPDAGLYVIMKKSGTNPDPENDRIVAKASVLWARKHPYQNDAYDALAFNAWERIPEAASLCIPFYREAALRAMEADDRIERVVMGKTITGYPRNEWAVFPAATTKIKVFDEKIPPRDLDGGQYTVATREQLRQSGRGGPKGAASVANIQHHGVIASVHQQAEGQSVSQAA